MSNSLKDQLLKAGLVDKKKAQAVTTEQRQQKKQQPKGKAVIDETKLAVQQAIQEKAEHDRELNRQHQAEAQHKAFKAQVKQIIESNTQDTVGGEMVYQFSDSNKIKKIHVTEQQHYHLAKGMLAIAKLEDRYHVIPARIAQKIQERDASAIVVLHQSNSDDAVEEDDFYADFKIPDDLMW
ncbi:MAG: DUF2058 domain-containing protein [Spongiibacteraceae bacterium]